MRRQAHTSMSAECKHENASILVFFLRVRMEDASHTIPPTESKKKRKEKKE